MRTTSSFLALTLVVAVLGEPCAAAANGKDESEVRTAFESYVAAAEAHDANIGIYFSQRYLADQVPLIISTDREAAQQNIEVLRRRLYIGGTVDRKAKMEVTCVEQKCLLRVAPRDPNTKAKSIDFEYAINNQGFPLIDNATIHFP